MKRYYAQFGDFANCYLLMFVETEEDEEALKQFSAERISRKRAEYLARRERERRKYDPAFSGYASASIKSAAELLIEVSFYH